MSEITYASIEPLIASTEESGDQLSVWFACPVSEYRYEGVGTLERGRNLADVECDQGLVSWVRGSLGSMLRGAFGVEASPRSTAGAKALRESGARTKAGAPSPYAEGERKAAAVEAFRSVANRFVWDARGERWIAAAGASQLLTRFARQLGVAPIVLAKDRLLLSRMLVEVARADGKVTPTEWRYLVELIPGHTRSVDTSMEQPDLSLDELDQASRGASRDTMLMLAWAVALTDEDLDDDETERLLRYARGLRIPEDRAGELRRFAADYLLEDAFRRAYPRGKRHERRRKDASALGERLGQTQAEVEAFEADFRVRHGID